MKTRTIFIRGFTLLELMMVVAIIAILASIVMVSLATSRNKGADAAVKSNLRNAVAIGAVFYETNSAVPNTYTSVCTNGTVGGAQGIGALVLAAAKATELTVYGINVPGSIAESTCNVTIGGDAWAAEAPLKTPGQMFCADSTGKSKEESGSFGAGTACL